MRQLVESAVAALALVLLAPVLAVIAVLVRRDSPGPVLFRQTRVGQHGVAFEILKFRTMRASLQGPEVTVAGDGRVTAVGRRLRQAKLDELPQLINVVRGEMAFVGPRPEIASYVELWPAPARDEILSVLPGITDPASLVFRYEEDLLAAQPDPERYYREVVIPAKVVMYRQYVRARCVGQDLRIAARTLRSVVAG